MVETLKVEHLKLGKQLFDEARRYIPGGVNSPVRSFKTVGGYPVFVNRAKGSKVYGECGREFIDYCLSWGSLILGHAHPIVLEEIKKALDKGTSFGTATKLETELARLIIEAVPSIERVRLTNSGTEAVMSAIRLSRAFTRREKIIKFEGSYHGHADYLLDCEGVPKDFTKHTLVLPYNDTDRIEETIKNLKDDIAAIIVEPVACNMGVVLPKEDFLQTLRKVASKYNIVLIFDEVITGFRVSLGGAQKFFNIKPDLTCLGKVIGGGLPVGAFGGRRDLMELLAPEGGVYQAGTFSGNPITVTAGITTLKVLEHDKPYEDLEKLTDRLCEEVKSRAKIYKIGLKVNHIASIFSIFFSDEDVSDHRTAKGQDINRFKAFYHGILKEGIYFSPSHLEANFLSRAHTLEDIESTLKTVDKTFRNLKEN